MPMPRARAARGPRAAANSRRRTRLFLRARLRPGVQIVDVIAHVAAVLAIFGAAAGEAHLLQSASREADIEGCLGGAKEGTSLLRGGSARGFIGHRPWLLCCSPGVVRRRNWPWRSEHGRRSFG